MAHWQPGRHSDSFDERQAVEGDYTLVIIGDPAGDVGGIAGYYEWYVEHRRSRVATGTVLNCKAGEAMLKAELAMANHARTLERTLR